MKKKVFYLFVLFLCSSSIMLAQKYQSGKITAITDGTVKFTEAKWSPDGAKIAFTEQGHKGIYVVETNDLSVKKLVDDLGAGYKFSWNPNSTEIAFRGTEFNRTNNSRSQYLATVNCSNLNKHIVIENQPNIDHSPKYIIEDGNQVLVNIQKGTINRFLKGAANNDKVLNNIYIDVIFKAGNLYSVTASGQELQLTSNGQSVYPVMSPDNSKVVFSSNDELIIMNLDGTNKTNLGKGYHPSFSPDGQHIVYHIATDDGYVITSSDLFITDINGNEKFQLTHTPDQIEEFPDWSPKGNAIVFNELHSGVIYKMELK